MDYSTVNKMFEAFKAVSSAGCDLSYELNNYQSLIEKDQEARSMLYQMFSQNIDLDYEDCLSYEQKQKLRDLHAYLLPGVPRVMRSIIEEAIEDAINKARRIIEARETSQRYTKEFNTKQKNINELENDLQSKEEACQALHGCVDDMKKELDSTIEALRKMSEQNAVLDKCNEEQGKIIVDLQAQVKTLNEQLFGKIIEDDDKI